jgi:hypothetical protein
MVRLPASNLVCPFSPKRKKSSSVVALLAQRLRRSPARLSDSGVGKSDTLLGYQRMNEFSHSLALEPPRFSVPPVEL